MYKKILIIFGSLFLFSNTVFAVTLWEENFNDISKNNKGAVGPTPASIDVAGMNWDIDILATTLDSSGDWFRVVDGVFEGRDLDGEATWKSESINITGLTGVSFSLDAIDDVSNFEASDYMDIYYSIDGGAFTIIPNWSGNGDASHTLANDWDSTINITQSIPDGSTSLKVSVRTKNSANAEYQRFDNVLVEYTNNSPTNIKIDGMDISNIDENNLNGENVGVLTSTDLDPDTFTYSLVAGDGDEDNSKFKIGSGVDSDKLQLNFIPDFETPTDLGDTAGNNTYSVRIKTDDGNGGIFEKSFIISINDLDEVVPVINLLGDNPQILEVNTAYTELGATATDNINGNISGDIIIDSSSVNMTTVGSYSVKYNVSDAAGNNATELIRIVNVLDTISPINPTINLVTVGDTVITGSGESGTTITLGAIICTNSPVIVIGGIWSCNVTPGQEPIAGDVITAISSDDSGNTSMGIFSLPNIVVETGSSGKSRSGESGKKVCKDSRALNFNNVGQHKQSLCKYSWDNLDKEDNKKEENNSSNKWEKNKCSLSQTLTQNMKSGDRDNKYSSWERGIITEVKLLQAHMNRLGFASGIVDGIIGPITDGAIKRMQKFLGTPQDGLVGPLTRALINNSCK